MTNTNSADDLITFDFGPFAYPLSESREVRVDSDDDSALENFRLDGQVSK